MKPIMTGEINGAMCGACGRFDSARWTLWVESDALHASGIDHRAKFRLCEDHYRRLMRHMRDTPNHDDDRPLRGYT